MQTITVQCLCLVVLHKYTWTYKSSDPSLIPLFHLQNGKDPDLLTSAEEAGGADWNSGEEE